MKLKIAKYPLIFWLIISLLLIIGLFYDEVFVKNNFVSETTLVAIISPIIFIPLFLMALAISATIYGKKEYKNDFPIKGWKWILYVIGLLFSYNIIFWIIGYLVKHGNEENKYFSKDYHKMVFWIGFCFMIIFILAGIGLFIF